MFKENFLKELTDMFFVLESNYRSYNRAEQEYFDFMKKISPKKAEYFFSTKNPVVGKYFMNLSSSLRNYLASYYSSLANFKAIIKKINIQKFEDEFENHQKSFLKIGENSFVYDLRTFSQHRKLPMVGGGIDILYMVKN